ncbi:MAG: acetate kinase [Planctomycetaceae bacterium]|nr:MAG: acetate kinase [Planctomycetaceae bacterium]
MKVFVVNCGSSSIKYQLFSMANETVLAKGIMERVGSEQAVLVHNNHKQQVVARDHGEGMKIILDMLVDPKIGVIKNVSEIEGVGHRVVHGGEKMSQSCLIDDAVIDVIRENCPLGPLHNPANLSGIKAAVAAMPQVQQVAVFDTAFMATLPPKAYRYAVPNDWYTTFHVRKYGFHGTSHRYVTLRTAELLGKRVDQVNLITVHLGNGCSMTAVANGKAVDHSMGMTPLEGLVMGTRSGDIDPAIVFYMTTTGGLSPNEVDNALNKQSGLLGVSGLSNDMRDNLAAVEAGNQNSELAVEMFVYRIVKYIGAYFTITPKLDAIVMTGGIGENSTPIRSKVVKQLSRLGIHIDADLNAKTTRGKAGPITTPESSTPVWVVPTNEELMIARDTQDIVKGRKK